MVFYLLIFSGFFFPTYRYTYSSIAKRERLGMSAVPEIVWRVLENERAFDALSRCNLRKLRDSRRKSGTFESSARFLCARVEDSGSWFEKEIGRAHV